MSVVVIGLQHTQAPLPLLEAAAVSDADLHKALSAFSHKRNVQEAVVLSTCLRTEVYAVVDRFHDAVAEIYDVLAEHSGLSVEELSADATVRFDDDVTSHLFSVTSGLESVVTGETEVVGQVGVRSSGPRRRARRGPSSPPSSGTRWIRASACAPRPESAGDHVVRLRRGDGGPRRGPDGVARRPVVVVGAGDMGLGVCRALSDIAPDDAPGARRRGQPLGGAGVRPGAPDGHRAVRDAGGTARACRR